MPLDVTYAGGLISVPPNGISSAPAGADPASLLVRLQRPLEYETGGIRQSATSHPPLTGTLVLQFPTSPLVAPVGYVQYISSVFVHLAQRTPGGVAVPPYATSGERVLHEDVDFAHRTRTLVLSWAWMWIEDGLVALDLDNARLARVRATFGAYPA